MLLCPSEHKSLEKIQCVQKKYGMAECLIETSGLLFPMTESLSSSYSLRLVSKVLHSSV